MGYHKGHKEFHSLDMGSGWHTPPGYPEGIQQKIIAGEARITMLPAGGALLGELLAAGAGKDRAAAPPPASK